MIHTKSVKDLYRYLYPQREKIHAHIYPVNTFLGETYMLLWLLLALVVVGAFIWYVNRDSKIDANDDGKVDLADAKVAVEKAVVEAKNLADVNKDGVVNVSDAVAAGKKVKAGAKKAAGKAKAAVKKPKLKVAK